MKFLLLGAISMVMSVSLTGQSGASSPITLIEHDKILAAIAKGGGSLVNGAEAGYTIAAGHRDKAGQVELHEKVTEIYYVIEGEATFVAGGTILDAKPTRPGNQGGSAITGGQTYRLKSGDGVVIPPMTPHWFKEVPKESATTL